MNNFTGDQFTSTFKIISAWGEAVERGESGDAELANIRTLNQENPDLLSEAIGLAELFQQNVMRTAKVSPDDPSHPAQRLQRIQTLKNLLGVEGHNPSGFS